jgi:prostaglandin-E synthase 1
MSGLAANPAFCAYAAATIVLTGDLLGLWILSGARRARGGVAINPEDGARFGAAVADVDPPEVARWLRAHRNAEATIYPFLLVGLLYVLAGGGAVLAIPIFAVFVAARLAHAVVYLRGLQPQRTIAFATSLAAIVALIAATLYVLLIH